MTLMLAHFAKNHFLQFWAQGCRPTLVISYTPLKNWTKEEKKGVEVIASTLYDEPDNCFAQDIDSDFIHEVRAKCYHLYLRTYFRQWRSQFGWKYSWLDINNKFESYVQHYWKLLRRHGTKVALFANAPHNGSEIILYYVCKAMGIQVVMCSASAFPDGMWIYRNIEDFGLDDVESVFPPRPADITETPISPFYMKGAGRMRLLELAGGVAKQSSRIAVKALTLSFIWNPRSFEKNFYKLRAKYRLFAIHKRSRSMYSEYKPSEKYVYFPLHLQPELSTDIYGEKYVDQILALEELARALPPDVLIYVKENPKQTLYMRDPSFFRRLRSIPTVRYLPVEIPTFELTRDALAVATITGTAGWEAIQMGKPVICFGYAWYRRLPGVFEWDQVRHGLAETISGFRFDNEALRKSFQQRTRFLWQGVFDRDYGVLIENYDEDKSAAVAARSMLAYLRCIGFDERGNLIAAAQPPKEAVLEEA